MNEKMKELIAIGASIAGHCQPCLTYHVAQARTMGIADHDIGDAIAVGHMVEKGAMAAMHEFEKDVIRTPKQQNATCCVGKTTHGRKSCCA